MVRFFVLFVIVLAVLLAAELTPPVQAALVLPGMGVCRDFAHLMMDSLSTSDEITMAPSIFQVATPQTLGIPS